VQLGDIVHGELPFFSAPGQMSGGAAVIADCPPQRARRVSPCMAPQTSRLAVWRRAVIAGAACAGRPFSPRLDRWAVTPAGQVV